MNVLDQISDLLKSEDPEQMFLAADMLDELRAVNFAQWIRHCAQENWLITAATWGGRLEDRGKIELTRTGSDMWVGIVNDFLDLCEAIDGRKPGPQE